MKRVYFFIAIVLIAAYTAKAQTSKGNMMIGGTVSIENNSTDSDNHATDVSFSPNFGYFIVDRLVVGAGLGITHYATTTNGNKDSGTSFSVAPFVRYYKFTSNDKFAFFGQGSVGFNAVSGGGSGTVSVSIRPGFGYFFNQHWAVDIVLPGFALSTGGGSTSVGLTASLSASSFGFRYHFGGSN